MRAAPLPAAPSSGAALLRGGHAPGRMAVGLLLALLCLPGEAAGTEARSFNCVGAERLEDDVFAIPFAPRSAKPGPAAQGNLEAAAALAKQQPERNICVLGHAGAQEGGVNTGLQLAARRAAAVAEALNKLGVSGDRIRAEARVAAFARSTPIPQERSVTVVVLPGP